MSWPSITVVIPTYNSERTIGRCLDSIQNQYYPCEVDVIVIDGISYDDTQFITKSFMMNIRAYEDDDCSPESAKAFGIREAHGDILCMMASDNILPHYNYFRDMIKPFMADPQLHASYSKYYKYDKDLNAMSRYFSILGGNDPVAWYLNKNDKSEYEPNEDRSYSVVRWNENNAPTLGDNGFFIRREVMLESDMDNFYHIDNQLDLIRKGHQRFALVNNSIIHDTGESFFPYLRKRYRHVNNLYFKQRGRRRYHVVGKCDRFRLMGFICYSLFGFSFVWSVRKYLSFRDRSVFLHPFVCVGCCVVYGYGLLFKLIRGKA